MAIQVSGTEVISNARALNNIASIDATTAASFAAGGVGGSTVKLVDNVELTNTPSTIEIPFSATYSMYKIIVSNVRSSLNTDSNGNPFQLKARLRDSSNNAVTSNYKSSEFRNSTVQTTADLTLSHDIGNTSVSSSDAMVDISLPYQSNNKVTVRTYSGYTDQYGNPFQRLHYTFRLDSSQYNSLYLYIQSYNGTNSTFVNNGTRYSVWGIK